MSRFRRLIAGEMLSIQFVVRILPHSDGPLKVKKLSPESSYLDVGPTIGAIRYLRRISSLADATNSNWTRR